MINMTIEKIHPLSIVKENNINSNFFINSYTYDISMDEMNLNLLEKA